MFETVKELVSRHQASVAELEAQSRATKAKLRSVRTSILDASARAERDINEKLEDNHTTLRSLGRHIIPLHEYSWDDDEMLAWVVGPSVSRAQLRVGSTHDQESGRDVGLPWSVPFVGRGRSIFISSSGEQQRASALELMQSLVMRALLTAPQQCKFTFLDPAGNGIAFPMIRHLPNVTPPDEEPRRLLDGVRQDITRIVQQYLDAATPTFEQIPEELRLNESYHFVFLADYPDGYSEAGADQLRNICETGPKAGVYTFVHVNRDKQSNATSVFSKMPGNALVVDLGNLRGDMYGLPVSILVDRAPAAELQDRLISRIKAAAPIDRSIDWASLHEEVEPWSQNSDDAIELPIGKHGANRSLGIWFGYRPQEERASVHAVLGAATGAGKSKLLHNVVSGLSRRFSPRDLRLFLLDGKYGVEFAPYRDLPHAEVVSLRTAPEVARSVLGELVEEIDYRNQMFFELGVAGLTSYRALGSPRGDMARVLLIADEYQSCFEGDKDSKASHDLGKISEFGRSAGVHLLLASQGFDVRELANKEFVFRNIHTRLAMQMPKSTIDALTEFGPKGRRLIAQTCDRVGRLVVNDRGGDDAGLTAGKVALISREQVNDNIALVNKLAGALPQDLLPRRTVINGTAQPDLVDNPLVESLLDLGSVPSASELAEFGRRSLRDGGFDVPDWLAAEHPIALLLGKEFNVRGQARLVLRRRPSQNVLMVGEQHVVRVAMTASAIVSVALQLGPGNVRVLVGDRSVPGTPWSDALEGVAKHLSGCGYDVAVTRSESGVGELVGAVADEVARRRALSESSRQDEPSLVFVLNEPERADALLRVPDAYGTVDSPLGAKLRELLALGPLVGVHTIIGATSLPGLRLVFDQGALLQQCRHRVVMQVSEDDSFALVGRNIAKNLQQDGPVPVAALMFDNQASNVVKFKPYTLLASDDDLVGQARGTLLEQIAVIADRMKLRAQ